MNKKFQVMVKCELDGPNITETQHLESDDLKEIVLQFLDVIESVRNQLWELEMIKSHETNYDAPISTTKH